MKKTIKINFKNETKKFFQAIDNFPLSSGYILGNLYVLASRRKRTENIICAINEINTNITTSQARQLISIVLNINAAHLLVLESANRHSMLALKQGILEEKRLFKHASDSAIITLGQDVIFSRQALIALIRKHIKENDPFENFNYKILNAAGLKQNRELLTKYIKLCKHFPVNQICQLGKTDIKIAEIIINDLRAYDNRFEIEAFFALHHPSLKKGIANDWLHTLQCLPITEEAKAHLLQQAHYLSLKFPEFKDITNISPRISRSQNNPELSDVTIGAKWPSFSPTITTVAGVVGVGIGLFWYAPHLFSTAGMTNLGTRTAMMAFTGSTYARRALLNF